MFVVFFAGNELDSQVRLTDSQICGAGGRWELFFW
jgi:hypothetical protein